MRLAESPRDFRGHLFKGRKNPVRLRQARKTVRTVASNEIFAIASHDPDMSDGALSKTQPLPGREINPGGQVMAQLANVDLRKPDGEKERRQI